MAFMEFLSQNKINTTTMLAVESATATSAFFFDRNISLGYRTSGSNVGQTTTVVATFATATVISNVFLQNHNLKNFLIFYNGTTTNSLFSSTTNSATSTYLSFSSVTVSSISLRMVQTITANQEKRVGEWVVAERQVQFERNPSIKDFAPRIARTQIIHEMPDGGTTVFQVRDKYESRLYWNYITQGFRDSLFEIFRTAAPIYFLAKPTTTGWDGNAYEVQWEKEFNFQFGSNVEEAGFEGAIELRQTHSG